MLLNTELDEQFVFLKMFIAKEDQVIKVEFFAKHEMFIYSRTL